VGLHGVKKADSRPASIKGSSFNANNPDFPNSHLTVCYEDLHFFIATISILPELNGIKVIFL
jgi:hypothetical protein